MTNIENLLPKYYKNSKYMHGLLHPCDVEFDRLYDKLDRTLKNLSVDDADETGIHDFETDFLIPLSGDTLELRRSKIKTKFLHTATTTFENLQNIVRAYDNGASISEDNPNYRIKIQSCKPLLLQEILNSVNEIIPAHIATTIELDEQQPQEHKTAVVCICAVSKTYETVGFDNNVADDGIINCANFEKFAVIDGCSGEQIQMAKYRTFEEMQQIDYETAKNKTYAELLYKEE